MYNFLAALPALLGLTGFVVFQLLKNQRTGDAITPKIVDKLRTQYPERFAGEDRLTSKQLHELLLGDQQLREEIGRQDFELLAQTLRQQHVQAMFVYSITAILFVIGAILFLFQVNRPEPTELSGISLETTNPSADGLLVDHDDFRVTWQSKGTPADIVLYAEHLRTGAKTEFLSARSTDGQLTMAREDYGAIISNRDLMGSNRIRIIAQAKDKSFYSEAYDVAVGAVLTAVVFDERVKVGVMIDNTLVARYTFEMIMATPAKAEVDYLTL